MTHDPKNPDPWMALALDQSIFMDQSAKDALLRNNALWSRKILLPVIRPLARLSIGLVRFIRLFIPETMTSSRALHQALYGSMKIFLTKDANYLILRHFTIGSQILRFLNDNLAEGTLPSHPLQPRKIEDVKDDFFLQHDLNIYNFIIELNKYLREHNRRIEPVPLEKIDFSAIQDFEQDIEIPPDGALNVFDLQSAIELYSPLYGLLLSRDDFERASNSLQLDETIAVYVATLLNKEFIMGLVNNKHPLVPLSTIEAGFRLMLHGLDAENLYGFIKHVRDSRLQANNLDGCPQAA